MTWMDRALERIRHLGLGWAMVVVAVLVAGMGATAYGVRDRFGPAPLRLGNLGASFFAAPAPPGGSKEILHGSALPCVRSGTVRLTGIDYQGRRNNQPLQAFVRHVSASEVRAGNTFIISVNAKNPHPVTRASLVPLEDANVTTRCGRDRAQEGFDEIILAMTADEAGNAIDGIRVHYRSGERSYSVAIVWSIGISPLTSASGAAG